LESSLLVSADDNKGHPPCLLRLTNKREARPRI